MASQEGRREQKKKKQRGPWGYGHIGRDGYEFHKVGTSWSNICDWKLKIIIEIRPEVISEIIDLDHWLLFPITQRDLLTSSGKQNIVLFSSADDMKQENKQCSRYMFVPKASRLFPHVSLPHTQSISLHWSMYPFNSGIQLQNFRNFNITNTALALVTKLFVGKQSVMDNVFASRKIKQALVKNWTRNFCPAFPWVLPFHVKYYRLQ
jgi:hypothetical protein